MSSLSLAYLNESPLFDLTHIDSDFSKFLDGELISEIKKYREFCLDNAENLEADLESSKSNLKIFSGTQVPPSQLLKQCALYLEQFLICDPLFPFSVDRNSTDDAFDNLIGMESSAFSRERLIQQLKYLLELRPMIAAGYVKIFPTTKLFERPKDIPFRASKYGFSEEIPEKLLTFFHENSVVQSVKNVDGKMMIDGSFDLGRSILVRFRDHGAEDAMGYVLTEQKILSVNEKTGTVETVNYLPSSLPDQRVFDNWVYQSINQTAGHLYKRVLVENELAFRFGASYLCSTPFLFELLQKDIPVTDTIQTNTVNTLLNFELPFVRDIDAEHLMTIRQNDGEAFQNFRVELDRQLKQLRLIKDKHALEIQAQNVFHEINEVQVGQIDKKLAQIKKQSRSEILLATAGFVGALQSGGFSLVALAIALLNGYKTYSEYLKIRHENSSFFLWKVLQQKT